MYKPQGRRGDLGGEWIRTLSIGRRSFNDRLNESELRLKPSTEDFYRIDGDRWQSTDRWLAPLWDCGPKCDTRLCLVKYQDIATHNCIIALDRKRDFVLWKMTYRQLRKIFNHYSDG